MSGQWWEDDAVEGSGDFWSADKVIEPASDAADPLIDQEVVTSARAWRGAGGGRGGVNDPRRLDTAAGRQTVDVENELTRLEKINGGVTRDELRPLAEFNVTQPKAKTKAPDRVEQYRKKGYSEEGAVKNAAFDQGAESRLNKPFREADADPVTGERISRAYNPNTEAERVAAEDKENALLRRDAVIRANAEEMPGFVRGLAKGTGQAIGLAQGTMGLVGDLTGNDELKEWGLEGYRDNMRRAGNLGVAKQFTEIGSAEDAAGWVAENAGYVAFQAAQSILAGGMGGVIGNTIGREALGTAVGLGLSNVMQTFGSVYGEAVDEAQRTGEPLDMRKVLVGATASAAIDTLADKIGLDAVTASGFKGNALSRLGKSIGMQMGVQGGTEAAQLVPEEFGAGRDPFRKGMADQYINEAAVGALGGAGPGVTGAINRNPADLVAQEFAAAMDAGSLPPAISPEATVMGQAPTMPMQPAVPQVDEKALALAARDEAMAAIGQAPSVDDAIAAANATVQLTGRAVQIDSDRLLDQALESAGIADALAPVQDQPVAADPAMAQPVAQPMPQSMAQPAQPVSFAQPGTPVPSRVVWTGRRGDGYATPEDANRALGERQRLRPNYDWSVQQNPEGRYVLEGSPKGQNAATQAPQRAMNAQAAPMAQNAPIAGLGVTNVSVQRQAPQSSVWAKSDDGRVDERMAAAVEDLAVASGAPGSIQLVSRAESLRELDVRVSREAQQLPPGAAAPDADSILSGIDDVGDAAATAFGWRPTLVKGLPNAFGVQYRGRTYLDIGTIAVGNKAGDSVQALVIQTIGHETTHALEKSSDPQDRVDWQRLRDVVLANAKPGVVDARIQVEGNGRTYGENEVVADVSGNFWLEPKFWQRLYELDNGSTMRRIAYKFMKNAARMLGALKSKRLDNREMIENIEQVREVAAQVWASKAKRGDSLFGGEQQTISKSVVDIDGFAVKTFKDGSIQVSGDAAEIRAMLPDGVVGRVVDGGLRFTVSDAPRVRGALSGDQLGYSRRGQVYSKLPTNANGEYIGAPAKYNKPGNIAKLRKILKDLTLEGAPGRFWYENSSEAVLNMTGGDKSEAKKFVALLSIYSPQAKVDANSTFALRAWSQYKAGQPISVKTAVMDRKATEALGDIEKFWSGEKTGNFYNNLLRMIDSSGDKQGATIDMWMMRAAQYPDDAPTSTQYAFMENETNRIAAELGWEPQQVQAAIWVAMKARMENKGVKQRTEEISERKGWIKFVDGKRVIIDAQKHRDNWLRESMELDVKAEDTNAAKFDFSDGIRRHIGQVSWEPRPSTKLPILPGIHAAPYEQQLEFYRAVQRAMLDSDGADMLAQKLGLLIDGEVDGPGVWEGDISAGGQKRIAMAPSAGPDGRSSIDPAQKQALDAYSAVLGLVLRQDGVGYHRPFYKTNKGDQNAVELRIGRPFSPSEAQQLWSAIDKKMRDKGHVEWEQHVGLVTSPQGIRVIKFWGLTENNQFRDLVDESVGDLSFDINESTDFASDGNLVGNNWLENTNGQDYQEVISRAGRSDLLGWSRDVLAPRVQAVFNEYSEKYGWGDPGSISFSRADADGDRAAQQGDGDRGQASGREADAGQPDAPSRSRAGSVEPDNRLAAPPQYGSPREGAVSVVGYHFSKAPRASLSGAFYGSGLKGDEAKRLDGTENSDIRPRVFFYVDRGNGVMPEFGVGPHPHHVKLDNIYDATADQLGLVRSAKGETPQERINSWERAIIKAGFDGYVSRDPIMPQHFAVLLGAKHSSVPVAKANPRRMDGKANIQAAPAAPAAEATRKVGEELVRRPVGNELMEIIKARQAGIDKVAPSFQMKYGEARVLESEAATADAVFEQQGAKFRFGEPSFSRDIDDLGAFNVDASISDMTDEEMAKFGIEPEGEFDMDSLKAELQAELDAEFRQASDGRSAPTQEAIKEAGLNAEDAFDFEGAMVNSGQGVAYEVPDFADSLVTQVVARGRAESPGVTAEFENGTGVFVNSGEITRTAAEKLAARQIAGAWLHESGHDIASAYRKNTILNIASSWKAVARTAGAFKFGEGAKSESFTEIADSMGAFKGYSVEVTKTYNGFNVEFSRESDGSTFDAEVTEYDEIGCCTMGLKGSGGLGTEFYAVMGRYAQNKGKRFEADSMLSAVNAYRRTEQALSFALKSGDTGVLLPGLQNRVYGYNQEPKTREDHDKNLARLALASMRNVEELFPDVRRLRYDPATDKFSDSQGDAEGKVAAALKNKDARAFGLGRSTIARAVITSQIVKGEKIQAEKFVSPIAYSLADVGLDEPMAESWGDERGGVAPGLRRFVTGSKIVNEDGLPVVMYHGTAQDIHAFRGKQAGAIFLSYSPRFAGDFAALSGQWMQDHWDQVLTPKQQEQAKKAAAAAVMADKSIKMTERKAMKQSIMDGKPEGMAAGAMNEAVRDMMPSGENILPVFVRSTAPFDFRERDQVDEVVGFLFDKNMAGESDKVRIRLVSEKGDRANMSARVMRELISSGAWDVIESPEVQEVIRELGHDGFFVKEDGQINLAVYDPGQVKSVFNRGTYDPLDERLSYSRAAGPKESKYQDNYLVPEVEGAFDDNSGNIAVMPALIFAKDGIRREYPAMPVRIRVGDHQYGIELKKQYGLQHRIGNKAKDASRGYITPELEGDNASALEVERAARDITLGILDAQTAYADGAPAKVYLHSPSLNRSTVLERQTDSKGKPFWSVVTSMPSTREQMMRRYKAPTSIFGLTLNGDRSQQSVETQRGILKKLREPGRPQLSAESYILDEDGLLYHQTPAAKSTNTVDTPKVVKQLQRDANGKIILNKRKAVDGVSMSRANGGFDLPEETRTQKARRKMQDYFLRSRMVQEAIASQGGVVNEQTDFYRAEELSHGRIGSLLQDFADKQVQPLMEKAVKFGIELDELSLYAYAMHAKERNAYIASIDKKLQDGGSGMTNAEADSILQLVELSGDKAKFEELHTDLMTITRGNRMAMLADGLITQDEFDALEGAYEYYVPLRGFEKLDEDGKPAPGRSPGKGFNIRGAETLKAKGRVSRAGQIIENIISDHQRTIVRGERNHVAKVFLNFALTNPDPEHWEIDATTTRKSIDRQTGRIARDTAIEKGEDTIAVKVKGREIYIKINDDLLLRALKKSYTDETGELTNDLMKSVGLYASLLRNTLTRYNPEFAVVNAMRDIGFGAAAALDELGEKGMAKFLAHYAGAMAVSARNESKKLDASREWDKWFLEYKAAGGTTSGFYAKGLEEISGDIRDMMIEAGAQPKDLTEKLRFNKATRAAKGALRVLEWAGSVSENAARVSAYRTAREMGRTPSQAASIAKNLTTNFDRKGEYGQLLNALYLFYNAAIQGTQRTLKMFKNPKVMGYMAGVAGSAIGLAMASATIGGDDPDDGMAYWDKIPAYVKERNIIIMLPPGAQVEGAEEVGTKGRYLTIPVQYGLNIFHVFGYQIADVIRNQADPVRGVGFVKAGINMASAVAGSFNPFGGAVDVTNTSSVVQAILPTIFDFPYQLASGTNAFGRDVAPFKSPFDSKPDSQNSNVRQAGGPAERVAQWLNDVTGGSEYESGVVDISAGTAENFVRNLTGGTGVFIYDVLALGGKWVEHIEGGDPDLYVRDIPIYRRVTGETAGDVDQGLFYERRKAIQESRAIEKGAEEAGGEMKDKEKLALAGMSSSASKYTRWLAEVRKEMKEVQRDEGLTAAERRLKLRELRAERDKLTAEFNADFTSTMRAELSPSRDSE